MLYPKCPTCKTKLDNKELIYAEKMNAICNNDKLSHKEKENNKKKVLTEIELHRECCRMRMMGYVDLINKIK